MYRNHVKTVLCYLFQGTKLIFIECTTESCQKNVDIFLTQYCSLLREFTKEGKNTPHRNKVLSLTQANISKFPFSQDSLFPVLIVKHIPNVMLLTRRSAKIYQGQVYESNFLYFLNFSALKPALQVHS